MEIVAGRCYTGLESAGLIPAGREEGGSPVAFGRKPLFGNHVEPACRHCRFSRETADGRMMLCQHQGVVAPYYSCRKYRYDPLRRVPSRQAVLPEYDKSDFEL